MNVIMNETRFWYCDKCDKTIKIKSKSKRFESKTHIHQEKVGILVKAYEIFEPIK